MTGLKKKKTRKKERRRAKRQRHDWRMDRSRSGGEGDGWIEGRK